MSPFIANVGTASAAQTFSVTGTNLTANITVTAPTNFEVASDGATYGSTATITQSGGSASGTVSVRVAASASAGPVSGNVTLASTTATGSVAVSGFVSGPVSLPYGPETFEISTGQWQTYSVASTKNWSRVLLGTDQVMQINGYDTAAGASSANDWLILGPITVPGGISSLVANFNIQKAFTSGQDTEFNLKVSTNYTGTGDPTSATWSTVDFTKPAAVANSGVTTMDASGNVVLPSSLHGQSGVYLAFHLEAASATGTSRWSVDDFALTTTTKPPLSLTGIPATINEGVSQTTATLSIPTALASDLVIDVTSSDATEALVYTGANSGAVTTTVTIPANETSATFNIETVADNEVDADQTVTLTATVADDSYQGATVNVTVKNVDLPSASLTGTGYTETFSTFAAATPTLPLGWSATGATTTFPATDNAWGEGTSGGFRGGASVLGYQHTGSTGTLVKTLSLKNETGAEITDLTISYKGRVARASEGRTPSYAVTVGGQAVPALAYSTADGDNTTRTASLTGLSIASGASFQISWSSDGSTAGSPGSGSRQQIGISEVSVTLGAAVTAPTLSGLSIPIPNVTRTQAQASANVTADGGAALTKRGFVIAATSANPNPEIGGTGVTNVEDAGTEVGLMTATFTGLSVGTGYTVKAYAINSVGTSYTAAQSFTTVGPAASFTGTYSESFDSYTGTLPEGWHAVSSTGVQGYGGEWGSGSAGGFRGTGATTGGVLGYQPTTTTGDLTVTLSLINNTGAMIETLNIGYLGRAARVDQTRISSWAVTLNGQAVAGLAYSTDNTSGEGGVAGDETKTTQLTGLSIANGTEFTLTWTSPNPTGTGASRQIGLADVVVSTGALNSAPTDIGLSAASIAENNAVDATVGTLSTTDADVGDSFTYTLVAGTGDTDNASFTIVGGTLRAGVSFNFEARSSYSVRVRTTDSANNNFEKQFTITVTDVNEVPAAPSNLSYSPSTVSGTVGTAISNLTPTVTGTVTNWSVSPLLPAGLSINPSSGVISGTPTAVVWTPVTNTVTASNAGGSTNTTVTAGPFVHFLESALGDFSGTTTAPTSIALGTSNKTLLGSVTGGSDSADYLTFTVPAGYRLDAVTLRAYQSTDNKAFIAIDEGATWTAGQTVSAMLGNSHFGPGDVGTDLLAKANVAGGSLAAGTYTIWVQQLGAATTYGLEFELSALPTGSTFAGWSGGAATNSELVGKYGIGGATNLTGASEKPVSSVDSNTLSLSAIVRTNDTNLTVLGEAGGSLTNWSTNGVSVTASTNTNGVPEGHQRKVFSVDRTNSPTRQFLRLKATLAP